MKITKRQLKRIIKEEKSRFLKEGQMKAMEQELIEDLVDMLVNRQAIRTAEYQDAAQWVREVLLPTLDDWSSPPPMDI